MKYIQSHTEYESNFDGFIIPKGRYSASERDKGKKNIVAIEDDILAKIEKGIVFTTMVNAGKLVVLDTLPDHYIDAKDKIITVQAENTKLKEENLKLKNYIKKYKIDTAENK